MPRGVDRDVTGSSHRVLWVRRSIIFALVGVGSGSLAHGLAGGAFPSLAGFLPPAVFATLVSLALLWRKTATGVYLSVFLSQWIFHHTVTWAAGPIAHNHHHLPSPLPVIDDSAAAMGAAHTIAALVTAFAVMTGDRAISSLVALAAVIWRRVTNPPCWVSGSLGAPSRPGLRPMFRPWSLLDDVKASPSAPRGPPVLAFS